jgi:hypothetical protein
MSFICLCMLGVDNVGKGNKAQPTYICRVQCPKTGRGFISIGLAQEMIDA